MHMLQVRLDAADLVRCCRSDEVDGSLLQGGQSRAGGAALPEVDDLLMGMNGGDCAVGKCLAPWHE